MDRKTYEEAHLLLTDIAELQRDIKPLESIVKHAKEGMRFDVMIEAIGHGSSCGSFFVRGMPDENPLMAEMVEIFKKMLDTRKKRLAEVEDKFSKL